VAEFITPQNLCLGTYDGIGTHSFLRAPDGSLTTFEVPGAGDFTYATGINQEGATTGTSSLGGFLRARNGTFTIFGVPVALGTAPVVINPAGAIAGFYFDETTTHGFLRLHNDTFTTVPEALNPFGINPAGAITGWYGDASSLAHGFLWNP
jgi:hypothetical protein